MTRINGNTLINWGFTPGPFFKDAITYANMLSDNGYNENEIIESIRRHVPKEPDTTSMREPGQGCTIRYNIDQPATPIEHDNFLGITKSVVELSRLPTVKGIAVLPDACPAGIIPVGAVVAAENAIHPGMHSADICCSMALTSFKRKGDDRNQKAMMDQAMKVTHFGPRVKDKPKHPIPDELGELIETFSDNHFLKGLETYADNHIMTQGDGNHFLSIGKMESTEELTLVTHHGSRGLGAQLYKRGMIAAKKHTSIVAPRVPKSMAWLDADSEIGEQYWDALQIIRKWTKMNHFFIHDRIARLTGNKVVDRFWNEHNFVFERDGIFYHGKGATPAWDSFSDDIDKHGRTIIPLNMAENILIVRGNDNPDALGFSPHGAGRNWSRAQHFRDLGEYDQSEVFNKETEGLDARYWSMDPDLSELPSAYKNADTIKKQIVYYDLAGIVDQVIPYGSIMAGKFKWHK